LDQFADLGPTIPGKAGGATTRRTDEMHLAVAPVLLGSGEHLFSGIDAARLGYECTEHIASANATHLLLTKRV